MDYNELIRKRDSFTESMPEGVLAKGVIYQQFNCSFCHISFPAAIPVSFGVVSITCPNCMNDRYVEYMTDIVAEQFETFQWDFDLTTEEKSLYAELRSRLDGVQLEFDLG